MIQRNINFDLAEGERRRDEALAAVETSNLHWQRRAYLALKGIRIGTFFSCDDLHALMGDDNPKHVNSYGAAIRRFAELGYAIELRSVKSKRPEAKARRVILYRRTTKTTR